MTQLIEMDQLGQMFKTDFLPFPKWLFFQQNFGVIFFKTNVVLLRYGNFIDDITTDW